MHRKCRHWCLAGVFVVTGILPRIVMAQTADAQSDSLIEQGVQRRQAGDDDGALVLFRQAYERSSAPRALAQMALAEQAVGDWVHADEHLRAALQLTADPWVGRNQQALEGALQQISRRLGMLDVRCPSANAELWVDGHRVGPLPRPHPVRVAAGTVMVEIRAEGFATQRRSVLVVAEQNARENFTLQPVDPASLVAVSAANPATNMQQSQTVARATAVAVLSPPPSSGGVSVGSVVVIGAGVLSMGLVPVFATLRSGAIGTCAVRGSVLECPTQEDAMRAENGRTYTTLVNVTLVAGSALLVGGAVWLVAGVVSGGSRNRAAFAVSPNLALGADGFNGLTVQGRF